LMWGIFICLSYNWIINFHKHHNSTVCATVKKTDLKKVYMDIFHHETRQKRTKKR